MTDLSWMGPGALALVLVRECFNFIEKVISHSKKNGNGNGNTHHEGKHKSGDLDPSDWEKRIETIIEKQVSRMVTRQEEVSEQNDTLLKITKNGRDITRDIADSLGVRVYIDGN